MRNHFSDYTRNDNGKLSGSGLLGVISGLASTIVLVAAAVLAFLHSPDAAAIMDKSILALTISAALLGVRKLSKSNNSFPSEEAKDNEVKKEDIETKSS
jgi:hypothetical protein